MGVADDLCMADQFASTGREIAPGLDFQALAGTYTPTQDEEPIR
jgi:hypothetical protein